MFRDLSTRFGGDHHRHSAAFHDRHLLDDRVLPNFLKDLGQGSLARLRVNSLAAPELDDQLRLIALREKTERRSHTDLKIVFVGLGPNFDLFDLDDRLLLFAGSLFFGLFVFEAAMIDDLTYWGAAFRVDLNEVKPFLFGDAASNMRRHDTELLAIFSDDTHLSGKDFPIDPVGFARRLKTPASIRRYGDTSC